VEACSSVSRRFTENSTTVAESARDGCRFPALKQRRNTTWHQ